MKSFYQKSVYLTQRVIKCTQNKNSLASNPGIRRYSMTTDDVVVLWIKERWKTASYAKNFRGSSLLTLGKRHDGEGLVVSVKSNKS